jgi:hypothetical protein
MKASMARRIRCAELNLISAIDRRRGQQRERSHPAQSTQSMPVTGIGRNCGRVTATHGYTKTDWKVA